MPAVNDDLHFFTRAKASEINGEEEGTRKRRPNDAAGTWAPEQGVAGSSGAAPAVATAVMPQSKEATRVETRRAVQAAATQLKKAKASFADKIDKLKKRARLVQREQERLRSNLLKYNNFVREKESKVVEGGRVFREEADYQRSIQRLLTQRREQLSRLDHAKRLIWVAVKEREVFREYLERVVRAEAEAASGRYADIAALMKRCETLVVTRDDAKAALARSTEEAVDLEAQLVSFKQEQNERILELSSKLNTLQDELYQIQAEKDSKQRLIDQEERDLLDKELSIANIRLCILTLWQYVMSRKVVLPSDLRKSKSTMEDKDKSPSATPTASTRAAPPAQRQRPPDIAAQLEAIQAHVEDLEAVIGRVRKAELADGYMSPLVSFSELRIDY